MISELNSSEIEDTRMYSSIKRLLSDDQMNCIPDIFSNIKSYKLTLFYTLCFISIDLFYLDNNDDNNQKDIMAKAFNEFLHNHLILSDENRIVLLSQLAKMQIASGNLQEAKITMQETESFSNIIQSPNFLYKYAVSKVDVATRLFIQTSIDDLKEKKNIQVLTT